MDYLDDLEEDLPVTLTKNDNAVVEEFLDLTQTTPKKMKRLKKGKEIVSLVTPSSPLNRIKNTPNMDEEGESPTIVRQLTINQSSSPIFDLQIEDIGSSDTDEAVELKQYPSVPSHYKVLCVNSPQCKFYYCTRN